MNGANAANKNDQLQSELDELAETLKNLNLEQQRIRIQTNQVQRRIRDLELEQRGAPTSITQAEQRRSRRDRHRDPLDIGDYVNFLTRGRFNSRSGTVTQISHARFISARDRSGRIINREPDNVEIVRKVNEADDRRRRFE